MKRSLRAALVVVVVGLVVLVGRSVSEPGAKPEPRTRIGLINMTEVTKGYTRVAEFASANKALMEPYQEKAKELKEKFEDLTKQLENKDLAADRREQLEKKLRNAQRQMEDLQNEAKVAFSKKSEEQMVVVYKEVMAEAERYARAHGLDLVMHYSDMPVDSQEYYSPANIARKLQAGATIPLYMAPGLDITKEIVAALNARLARDKKDKQPKEKEKDKP